MAMAISSPDHEWFKPCESFDERMREDDLVAAEILAFMREKARQTML
jgi:hypothetical protein